MKQIKRFRKGVYYSTENGDLTIFVKGFTKGREMIRYHLYNDHTPKVAKIMNGIDCEKVYISKGRSKCIFSWSVNNLLELRKDGFLGRLAKELKERQH